LKTLKRLNIHKICGRMAVLRDEDGISIFVKG
jgi:hypothetical protein